MRISINMGHTLTGLGTGAVGIVKETDKNREVGKRLIAMLQEKGHTVYNSTVDQSNNDLADIVSLANKQNVDLFVSLHLNSFHDPSANGVETYIYNGSYSGKESLRSKAQSIQNALVNDIGWYNRGVKEANFYVLRQTICPAILVELGFCSSQGDMNKWNTEKIAAALFRGITGQAYVKPTAPTQGQGSADGSTYYRVCVGSFADKNNAIAQQNKLKAAGFDSFLVAYKK